MLSWIFLKDVVERVVWTFAQAFLGAIVALDGAVLSDTNLKIAGGAALVSLLKGIVASQIGNKESAASLPG